MDTPIGFMIVLCTGKLFGDWRVMFASQTEPMNKSSKQGDKMR